jgi:hypothetical protein
MSIYVLYDFIAIFPLLLGICMPTVFSAFCADKNWLVVSSILINLCVNNIRIKVIKNYALLVWHSVLCSNMLFKIYVDFPVNVLLFVQVSNIVCTACFQSFYLIVYQTCYCQRNSSFHLIMCHSWHVTFFSRYLASTCEFCYAWFLFVFLTLHPKELSCFHVLWSDHHTVNLCCVLCPLSNVALSCFNEFLVTP